MFQGCGGAVFEVRCGCVCWCGLISRTGCGSGCWCGLKSMEGAGAGAVKKYYGGAGAVEAAVPFNV